MAIILNKAALDNAEQLIKQEKVDRMEGNWSKAAPTTDMENNFLKNHTWTEYGVWYLGINTNATPNTKERYEFPIGNFTRIFLSGVIAAEQRASQHGHEDIKHAAQSLFQLMGKNR